eukprot:4620226-Heterocapsa_arctica.AAC.1
MIYDRGQHVMKASVAEPVRLPDRSNPIARQDWMNFSYALTTMLRHTGGGWNKRTGHDRITD